MTVQRADRRAGFAAALERGQAAGQGMWTLSVLSPELCLAQLHAAACGDHTAAAEVEVIGQALDYIYAIRRARWCCCAPIRRRAPRRSSTAFVLVAGSGIRISLGS